MACEIRRNATRITRIVVVGVAVVVDITEIVAVVVIRGTNPPMDGRTPPNRTGTIIRNTPIIHTDIQLSFFIAL